MIAVLVLYHAIQYSVGAYFAIKARNIPPDFQEAKWVLLAFFTQVQLTVLGVPILFALDTGSASVRFLVTVSLISLLFFSILFLLFVPKAYRLEYGAEGVEVYTTESRNSQQGVIIVGESSRTSRISRGKNTGDGRSDKVKT